MITEKIRSECECEKCGHAWFPDSGTPKMCPKCKSKIWHSGKVVKFPSLTEQLKALNNAERLDVFEEFELCCGMLRGSCICPEEEFVPVIPETDREKVLANLRKLMEDPKTKPEPVEENWQFTKDAPQYADDGCVYRKQLLGPEWKKQRTVRVDPENHEFIERVVIR